MRPFFRPLALTSVAFLLIAQTGLQGKIPKAEACGMKLTAKSVRVKRPVEPSSNPSRILVVGDSDDRTTRVLKRAGHQVEHVDSLAQINNQRADYRIVMVDTPEQVASAKSAFPNALVMPKTQSASRNLAQVEDRLRLGPVRSQERRTAVGAQEERAPIAAGPDAPQTTAQTTAPISTLNTTPQNREQPSQEERIPAAAGNGQEQPQESTQNEVYPVLGPELPPQETIEESKPKKKNVKAKEAPAKESQDFSAIQDDSHPKIASSSIARFPLGAVDLREKDLPKISRLAAYLNEHKDKSLLIAGHSDASGPRAFNYQLGLKRAEHVKELFAQQGVESDRIEVKSYGEDHPVFKDPGDPRNRCVVLTVK